jgi:sigma-B regulation protein RsbU (phosphoserine phosphatase)
MNKKIKQIGIPFILMLIFNLGIFYINGQNFGGGLSPHVGVLLVSGLLFGPYGAIGSVVANFLCDLIRGYSPIIAIASAIVSFAISYLAYKLWYNKYKKRTEVTAKIKQYNQCPHIYRNCPYLWSNIWHIAWTIVLFDIS